MQPEDYIRYDLLPTPLAGFLQEQASLGIPKVYLLNAIFPVLGNVVGSKLYFELYAGSRIRPNVYMVLVGPPSIKKTPVVGMVTAPLGVLNNQYYSEYLTELVNYEGLSDEDQSNALKPEFKVSMIDDVTEESLLRNLSGNPSVLIRVDELARLGGMLGKYNGSNSMSFFLENYNNKDFTKTRVASGPVHLPFTAAPVLGGVQPKVLLKLFGDRDIESGLLSRFLFVGFWQDIDQPYIPLEDIPKDKTNAHHAYEEAIIRIHRRLTEVSDDIQIRLGDEAARMFDNYRREIHEQKKDCHDPLLFAYYGKNDTNMPRFITLSVALRLAYEESQTKLEMSLGATKADVEFAIGLDRYYSHMHSQLSEHMRTNPFSDKEFAMELYRRNEAHKENSDSLLNQKLIAALAGISEGQLSKIKNSKQ